MDPDTMMVGSNTLVIVDTILTGLGFGGAGILGWKAFIRLQTKFEVCETHNREAHKEIKDGLSQLNGTVDKHGEQIAAQEATCRAMHPEIHR